MSVITIVKRFRCWETRESVKSPTTFIRQQGFLQICGSSHLREMQIVSDQISSLKQYKLCCNCNYCISFSQDNMVAEEVITEPFMTAATVVFNTLAKFEYKLQSTTSTQNADQSTSITWIWVQSRNDGTFTFTY